MRGVNDDKPSVLGAHTAMDQPSEQTALIARLQSCCSSAEWAALRARIFVHEQRLQGLAPAARNEAVVDALICDATTNPALAVVLERMGRQAGERRKARGPLN